jgi:hypothetical protein
LTISIGIKKKPPASKALELSITTYLVGLFSAIILPHYLCIAGTTFLTIKGLADVSNLMDLVV